ncbi:MAG: diaminopimelate decarboxylase, partial [Muribaculaceae bacterium]|nr:diaminopimelate decarboxylase [Muribaculaceae bacterium]
NTASATEQTYDIAGPICESSDVIGTDRSLPTVNRGNLLAIRSAGAYGEVMASHYNLRPLPPAVFSY